MFLVSLNFAGIIHVPNRAASQFCHAHILKFQALSFYACTVIYSPEDHLGSSLTSACMLLREILMANFAPGVFQLGTYMSPDLPMFSCLIMLKMCRMKNALEFYKGFL